MKSILIFGTGDGSRKMIKYISRKYKISAYIDNNKEKIGSLFRGKLIISPTDISEYKYDYIFIGSMYFREIQKQLMDIGIENKKICLFYDEKDIETYKKEIYPLLSGMGKLFKSIQLKCNTIKKREAFNPTTISIIFHPFYIIRKALRKTIVKNKGYINGVCMDFGCGSKPYESIFDLDKYIGIDLLESGHIHSNEEIDYFYDGKTIPFENEHFDSVFTSEVFEHIFNIEEILPEINRVLKFDGNIMITIPFVWNEHEVPYDFARYTSFGIKSILEKNGFKILVEEKTNNFIEAILQMWCTYVYETLPKNKILRVALTVLLIFPTNLFSIILSKLLPNNMSFYNNIVIVAKKRS